MTPTNPHASHASWSTVDLNPGVAQMGMQFCWYDDAWGMVVQQTSCAWLGVSPTSHASIAQPSPYTVTLGNAQGSQLDRSEAAVYPGSQHMVFSAFVDQPGAHV